MSSINESVFINLEKSSKEKYIDGSGILLKLIDNVIREPDNNKYRTIRLENKVIKEKLLCLNEIMPCLEYIGFQKNSGELRLPSNVLIAQLKKYREFLIIRIEAIKSNPVEIKVVKPVTVQQQPGPSCIKKIKKINKEIPEGPPKWKSFQQRTTFPKVIPYQNSFLQLLEHQSDQVMQYEDAELKKYGLSLIPVMKLTEKALKKSRLCQKTLLKTKLTSSEQLAHRDPCFRDILLVELTNWFNMEFFTWINGMPCKKCGNEDVQLKGNLIDNGIRVETYTCCNETTKFYRFNDISILLKTRKGRCGEYANCFTFLARCMGYDARMIYATFDHVWTEVYSMAERRWLHVDPSDNVIDSPLMYQYGWKRSIDYCIGFSWDDIQDVTHRYCNTHIQLLEKRKKCTEDDLLETIFLLRKKRQSNFTKIKCRSLAKRNLLELIELMTTKEVTENERKGRSSGNLTWKLSRGEQNVNTYFTFTNNELEAQLKQFNVRFSMAKNCYERYTQMNGKTLITQSDKNWDSCYYLAENIFHKIERDWKMVYLARVEGSDKASISWNFDFTKEMLKIKTIFLKLETKTYENGKIIVSIRNELGNEVKSITDLIDTGKFSIKINMEGGIGDIAWQHTQLFRQKIDSIDYPFELKITFH